MKRPPFVEKLLCGDSLTNEELGYVLYLYGMLDKLLACLLPDSGLIHGIFFVQYQQVLRMAEARVDRGKMAEVPKLPAAPWEKAAEPPGPAAEPPGA